MTYSELLKKIYYTQSFLYVGLNPDPEKIPDCFPFSMSEAERVLNFIRNIIDATAGGAVAFSLDPVYYTSIKTVGLDVMQKIIDYIKFYYPGKLVIINENSGRTGNAAEKYASFAFDTLKADAATIIPYHGINSVSPFLKRRGKWLIVSAFNSHHGDTGFANLVTFPKGTNVIRTRTCPGKNKSVCITSPEAKPSLLHEQMIETIIAQGGTKYTTMFSISTSPYLEDFKRIRKIAPNHFLLVPDVSERGGWLEDVVQNAITKDCCLLVEASASILYADNTYFYAHAAGEAAQKLQKKMEQWLLAYTNLH